MKSKLISILNKTKKVYGDVYSNYPITTVLVAVATLLCCAHSLVVSNSNISYEDRIYSVVEWWMFFSVYMSVGCFGVEAFAKKWYEKSKGLKMVLEIVVLSFISGLLVSYSNNNIFGFIRSEGFSRINGNRLLAWNIAYFLIIALTVLYCRYKESGHTPEQYFVGVFTGGIQIGIAWAVLALGFLLLSFAFNELVVDIGAGISIPQILIIGIYVAPTFMMTVTKIKDEIGRFFEALIKYAMLIITLAGAAIIYLYMIKVIITGIPSNEIFSILAVLFIIAIPVGFACTSFERDTFLQKIAYVLPYIYAPFIILQCYSIISRIIEYGMTPSRYVGLVLILLEVVYTLVYAFSRENTDKILLFMIAVTAAATIVPGINANDFSITTQKNVVTRLITAGVPQNETEQKKLVGAYDFLVRECDSEYIDGFLSKEQEGQIVELKETINKKLENSDVKTYSISSYNSFIPLDGFDFCTEFYMRVDEFDGDVDPEKITIEVSDEKYGPFDLSKECDYLMQRCNKEDTYDIEGKIVAKVSDDIELVITEMRLEEDTKQKKLLEITISGYVLLKEDSFDIDITDTIIAD